jgi:hypothetical protein
MLDDIERLRTQDHKPAIYDPQGPAGTGKTTVMAAAMAADSSCEIAPARPKQLEATVPRAETATIHSFNKRKTSKFPPSPDEGSMVDVELLGEFAMIVLRLRGGQICIAGDAGRTGRRGECFLLIN